LATLPTISGRITDITRLTPQYGGSGTFAGQDNRANNVTVDGSYFNNSFGLGVTTGGIGDRTGVAPISLEAIEQVQVSVAPYDVRPRVGSQRAELFPFVEVQLRHRRVRQHLEADAGQAVDAQGRLQRQQRKQGHLPVQPAQLEYRRQPVRLVVARHQPLDAVDAVPDVRQLELPDPREPQVGRRRVELGVREHDEQ